MAHVTLTNGISRLDAELDDDCDSLQDFLDLYREQLNIPSDANLAVNGEPVDADSDPELQDGDIVSATKTTGSKG